MKDGNVDTLDDSLSQSIDSAIESAMKQSGSTEAVVGVWTDSGEYARGYGDDKVDANVRFRAAQSSAPVICALVLDLVDDGKLTLDRKISKDLPRQVGIDDITYGQLCTMRASIADYKKSYADIFTNNPTRSWPSQELLAQGQEGKANPAPGEDYLYSDTNYVLLARLLQVKERKDISKQLQERVFKPADMNSTYYPEPGALTVSGTSLDATTYPSKKGSPNCKVDPVSVPEVDPSMLSGAGATITTVTDLKNFYQKYVGKGYGGDAAQAVTEAKPTANPKRNKEGKVTKEAAKSSVEWTFGMEKRGPLYGNGGAITGTISASYYDPKSGFSVVVALNNSSAGQSFAKRLAFELAALSHEAGTGPDVTWTSASQAAALKKAAVCQ